MLPVTSYMRKLENNIKMYITGTGCFDNCNEMTRLGFNDQLL